MIRWKRGSTSYALGFFCLVVYIPNEADITLIYGLFWLDGGWHFGWPEAL